MKILLTQTYEKESKKVRQSLPIHLVLLLVLLLAPSPITCPCLPTGVYFLYSFPSLLWRKTVVKRLNYFKSNQKLPYRDRLSMSTPVPPSTTLDIYILSSSSPFTPISAILAILSGSPWPLFRRTR